jgi:exodeoxyribonuclease VII large subunit
MATLPLFDGLPDTEGLLSVSELTDRIRTLLALSFPEVGVRGEVSNVARPRSGHVYFSLKDETAQIRAVIWRSLARSLVFDLEDGLAVRAWGEIDVYAPRGDYQLIVRSIEPEGIGALELAFRQTVARLAAEGLFDPTRKRPLPPFPSRIAVVTSPTGAAIRDLLHVLHRRWPAVEVWIVPVPVQGPGAAAEIARGITQANRLPGCDLIITGRGGGSLEDLWPFNEEVVARAIFTSRLPVVTGIGHEIDVTVADLVADVHAPTPTAAGERAVPDVREVRGRLDLLRDRLARATRDHLADAHARLDDLRRRVQRAIDLDLRRRRDLLARRAAQLDALSPLQVLARGYSLTYREGEASPLRSVADLRPGDRLRTLLADGSLLSRVEAVDKPAGDPPP